METKNCQNCKKDFTVEEDDFSFYEKMKVPPPTFCPECRMIRRFHFRNESLLFRRKDGHSGKEIFSGYSPESSVVTYENSFWYGDAWDPLESGFDYDFSQTFFKQFSDLLAVAPIPARSVFNMVNSDYCNEASESKNCYLCFNTDYIEDSAYLRKVRQIKSSFDLYECSESTVCYQSVTVDKSYRVFYSIECDGCVDVWFSKNLRNCTNCFGCINLVNKTNCIFNVQYSKEEYLEKIKSFNLSSYKSVSEIKEKAYQFFLSFPVRHNQSLKIVNATGDKLYNSKNLKDCFYVKNAENLAYCQDIWDKTSSCYDYSVWGDGAENIYESMTCGIGISNLKFCFNCWDGARDMEYCGYCVGSSDCFGCVGLYKKRYCIFNKQYSKEEYFKLVEQVKLHMDETPYVDSSGRTYKYGEFFPFELAPYTYNESLAQTFFPVRKEEVESKGYFWRDPNIREFPKTILSKNLPDDITDLSIEFLKEVIECELCKRAFRIIESEFQFYQANKIPVPRRCSDCRFVDLFKFVNPPKFYSRQCVCGKENHNNHKEKCEVEFETSYAPDRPEIVYCEKCYQQEVY